MKDNSLIQIWITISEFSSSVGSNEKQLTPDFFFWWQDDEVSHENIPLKKSENRIVCHCVIKKEQDQFLGSPHSERQMHSDYQILMIVQ